MINRIEIITRLNQIVENKIRQLQGLIEDLRNSHTDTKSSMGDKYETSREMLQQEIMQIQWQLAVFQQHQIAVKKLMESNSDIIKFGSIVKTTFGNFIIVTSLGEFELNVEKFISISEQTPLAEQLIGKKSGDFFLMNQKIFEILKVG